MRPDPLPLLVTLSVAIMAWVMLSLSPTYLRKLSESSDDAHARRQHHDSRPVWGVREFLPNNAPLPRLCPAEAEQQPAARQNSGCLLCRTWH